MRTPRAGERELVDQSIGGPLESGFDIRLILDGSTTLCYEEKFCARRGADRPRHSLESSGKNADDGEGVHHRLRELCRYLREDGYGRRSREKRAGL